MAIIFDEPKHPVIDDNPSIRKIVSNFSLSDYRDWAGFIAIGWPVGYFSGQRAKLSRQGGMFCGFLGAVAGYLYAYQSSSGRLMGIFPNDAEVKAYKRK